MVGEMLAILLSDIYVLRLKGEPMTPEQQKDIFGRSFEKLGQERRMDILWGYGIIRDTEYDYFEVIRSTRNKYLHLWSQDHAGLPKDAIIVFNATLKLVVWVIGQDVKDGKIVLQEALIEYLKRKGICRADTLGAE